MSATNGNTWHGYPQHPDAHPERPWWRRDRSAMVRSDGVALTSIHDRNYAETFGHPFDERGMREDGESYADATARIDREHPLPAPPPMCGQVWVWLSGFAATVQAVDPTGMSAPRGMSDGPGVVWPCTIPAPVQHGPYLGAWTPAALWPPPGAVLVAGPGAPWADTSEGGDP